MVVETATQIASLLHPTVIASVPVPGGNSINQAGQIFRSFSDAWRRMAESTAA